MKDFRQQRIRDPLHNRIVFGSDQFEQTLWRVIQTPQFQRLRRIRQLGFSEFVFPGATHTRFAHSVGVFHVARQLMQVIRRNIDDSCTRQFREHQAQVAIAAALVHDVGHCMFSHAFRDIGDELKPPVPRHETLGSELISDSEITAALQELGSGFARDVAEVIQADKPANLYDSVVSSQFDADRLDYMQRDRMMTGVESSGIDATWLLANLEVAPVPTAASGNPAESAIETLVVGQKAFRAAENYVLSLFQLYPNVYFHKATRAAEKVFSSLMLRMIELVHEGHQAKVGLQARHPLLRFASRPDKFANALWLDDALFWGALPMMVEAKDAGIADFARRLWRRDLPKCIDVRQRYEDELPLREADRRARAERREEIDCKCENMTRAFRERAEGASGSIPRILIDKTSRSPYKKFRESQSLLNQILIRSGSDKLDMADISPVVESAETFEVCRIYFTDPAVEPELRSKIDRELLQNLHSRYRTRRQLRPCEIPTVVGEARVVQQKSDGLPSRRRNVKSRSATGIIGSS